jgi:hypothetical protein
LDGVTAGAADGDEDGDRQVEPYLMADASAAGGIEEISMGSQSGD